MVAPKIDILEQISFSHFSHFSVLTLYLLRTSRTHPVATASDLPSWVPDFKVYYAYNGHKVILSASTLFNVPGPKSSLFRRQLTFKANELHFHGICINTIQIVQLEANLDRHPSLPNLFALLSLYMLCTQYNSQQSRIGVL